MRIENLDGVRIVKFALDDARARVERERRGKCLDEINRNVAKAISSGLEKLGEHESDVFQGRVNQCCGSPDVNYRNLVALKLYVEKYGVREMGVEDLSEEDKKGVEKRMIDNLYDRDWCRRNGINYCYPEIEEAREKTYREMFEDE